MIGPKRARIFPLRIDGSIAFADRDPSTFASGNGRALVCFPEPRNDLRRFRSMASGRLVVVGERAVKRILPRREFYRNVITPMRAIWIVKPAITSGPIFVPGARAVRHGIVCARFFPDPKDGCHDVSFPRITLSRLGRRWRPMPRRERERINIQQNVLRQFVRFFAGPHFGRLRLFWRRVREKRRNRRQQDCDCVSNGSGLHFVTAPAQRAGTKRQRLYN